MIDTYRRAQRGDPHAVKSITDSLRNRVERMAAHYARRCREDEDDLRQEAWAGLLEALTEVDIHIGSPDHYLLRCARWRLLDAVRRERIRRCSPLDLHGEQSAPDDTHTADMADFVLRLKSNQRAIVACLLAGLTWRETGDQLGCTSANIAYHMRQIKQQFEEWR